MIDKYSIIDLTYKFNDETIYWPTEEGFRLTTDARGLTEGGYYYEAHSFAAAEHGGTHLDAPIHFAKGKWTVDEIPLDRLIGGAIRLNVSEQCSGDRDYQVGVEDFLSWEKRHGVLPDGIIVLLHTGFGEYWPDRLRYLGTEERGAEAVSHLHFPGLAPEAARWLVENRSIKAIGLDTASIDYGQSTGFESHRILFEANIPALENVAGLDRLPSDDFVILALPMKIGKGSGGPLRIVALVPNG